MSSTPSRCRRRSASRMRETTGSLSASDLVISATSPSCARPARHPPSLPVMRPLRTSSAPDGIAQPDHPVLVDGDDLGQLAAPPFERLLELDDVLPAVELPDVRARVARSCDFQRRVPDPQPRSHRERLQHGEIHGDLPPESTRPEARALDGLAVHDEHLTTGPGGPAFAVEVAFETGADQGAHFGPGLWALAVGGEHVEGDDAAGLTHGEGHALHFRLARPLPPTAPGAARERTRRAPNGIRRVAPRRRCRPG